MKRKYIITGLTCAFLCITGICYSCAYSSKAAAVLVSQQITKDQTQEDSNLVTGVPAEGSTVSEKTDITGQPSKQDKLIYVHICGAVVKPGVYQAKEGARLFDLIKLSGGLTGDAAADYINQAEQVKDGQRIYIPTGKEVDALNPGDYMEGSQTDSGKEEANGLVNINTADTEQLMSLPGIGEAKAASIIEYRNANGEFKAIEELMNIPGIKEGLFGRISSKIAVN